MTTSTLPQPPKAPRLWTYEDMVAELPESNLPVELWNGEIIMSPTPNPTHQTIVLRFAQKLDEFISKGRMGKIFLSPLDIVLTPHRVVQPDVFFIAQDRLGIVGDHVEGVPDLAVEVISATSWKRDRVEKKALYEQSGVREYWIIDPVNRLATIYSRSPEGRFEAPAIHADTEKVKVGLFPELEIDLEKVFPPKPPRVVKESPARYL